MTYKKTGDLKARARRFWQKSDTMILAQVLVNSIQKRAFMDSKGANDREHKRYSTKPIYISNKSKTARRLKPKGGVKTKKGRFYAGGYRQYKMESQKSGGRVNLTLSGQLLRSIRITKSAKFAAKVGMTGSAKVYGRFVDQRRPFMGISRKDSKVIAAAFHDLIKSRLAGRRAAIISAGNTSRAY